MGNRLSGLWCKKTATIHINNDSKQQQQQQKQEGVEISDNNTRNSNNNKSSKRKSGGAAGTFRLGSARRLSLTSCVSRDKTEKKTTNKLSGSSVISTIEQQYEELLKTPVQPAQQNQTLPRAAKSAMKVDVKLPTVKVRVISVRGLWIRLLIQSGLWLWRLNLQFVAHSVIICGSATEI